MLSHIYEKLIYDSYHYFVLMIELVRGKFRMGRFYRESFNSRG